MSISFSRFENKRHFFFLLLFIVIAVLRLPTLFNDYYDVDELSAIVQVHEYIAGDVPNVDFKESKLPVYHALFKAAYFFFPERGWVLVHIFTIFIIFITACFIYLSGNRIKDLKTGAIASLFYGIFVSSFNRHFMATNGEIVYNLPIAAGLYFIILFISRKNDNKWLLLLLFIFSALCGVFAANVKFHGLIFFIFLAVFFIIYLPFYKKITKKYLYFLLLLCVVIITVSILDYFLFHIFANSLLTYITNKIPYAFIKGFNPLIFIVKFIHRQGMLILWHFAVWLPAAIFLYKFIKNKFRQYSMEAGAAVILFLLTYFMIFLGGSRLYFHYFLAVYPGLCIISAISLQTIDTGIILKIQKKLKFLIFIPAIFFLSWNTKDIIIKHFFPQAFYNEGRILYWARAVLIGTFNDYLLPEASYKDVCAYIKQITQPDDRIFVWGDGPYLYYFSERRMGTWHLWPKTTVYRITNLYNKGDEKSNDSAELMEQGFIDVIIKKKPVLFIDTSENGLSTFNYKVTPLLQKYIQKNYLFIKAVSKMKIYKRRGIKNN